MGSITPSSAVTIAQCNNCIAECDSKMAICDDMINNKLTTLRENQKTIETTTTELLAQLGTEITFAKIDIEVANKIEEAVNACKAKSIEDIYQKISECRNYYKGLKSDFINKRTQIQNWLDEQERLRREAEEAAAGDDRRNRNR